MRKKKLLANTFMAILKEIIVLVSGLIIPRLIISQYGSATNGLLSSITQFLAFFSMMEMGVGAVVRASLYKPLADHDHDAISRVLISSRRFFNKIGLMLCVYSAVLMAYFPLAVDHSLGYLSTVLLVGAVAFSSVANYMLGIIYQQLLNSDQKSYIQFAVVILVTVLNTLFSVILIRMDAPIEVVKLAAALVLLLRPLLLRLYVNRHYQLNLKLKLEGEPLKQKWNGLAQHIATYVLKHADTVILTVFSSLENVSIYYVYHLVTNGLQQIIEICTTGMAALLGNMYAKKETEKLQNTFSAFEWTIHTFVTFLYSVAGVLVIPFVTIYTKGITDANYVVPLFAVLIITANASYCFRMPYVIMVNAAGHFKETQTSAIIEAALNVVVSIALVKRFGLVGVAFGTMAAMMYRTVYLAWYLRGHILHRTFLIFMKHVIVDFGTAALIVATTRWIQLGDVTWISWVIMAVKVAFIAGAEIAIVNLLLYRRLIKGSIQLFLGKKRLGRS